MKPARVKDIVEDTPCMSLEQAVKITEFLKKHRCKNVLELGFAHGVSTCYIASALKENGGGRVTTIDLTGAKRRSPSIEELLENCDLSDMVDIYYEPQSFTWRLMKMIEDGKGPRFDFVYLDGGHSWDVTGYGFFLVDKLLKNKGWLLFDDLRWSYSSSQALSNSPKVKAMPEDFRETAQVGKVFELLVQQHPDYQNNFIDNKWGFAQKRKKWFRF